MSVAESKRIRVTEGGPLDEDCEWCGASTTRAYYTAEGSNPDIACSDEHFNLVQEKWGDPIRIAHPQD